jgi:hypothetical protein
LYAFGFSMQLWLNEPIGLARRSPPHSDDVRGQPNPLGSFKQSDGLGGKVAGELKITIKRE